MFWVWPVLTCGQQFAECPVNSTFHICFHSCRWDLAKVPLRLESRWGFCCQITSVNSRPPPRLCYISQQKSVWWGFMIKLLLICVTFTGLDQYLIRAGARALLRSGSLQCFKPSWCVSRLSSQSRGPAAPWWLSYAGQTLIRGPEHWQRSPPVSTLLMKTRGGWGVHSPARRTWAGPGVQGRRGT